MCFCHGSLPGYPARTGTEPFKCPLLCCLGAACIATSPAGKLGRRGVLFSWAWNKGELAETWHNAVTHLVSAFRRLSFPSPSEYVKEVSLYITNHGLNFKVLDKNDLTLHLWMSFSSHPNTVSMGTNVHQRKTRERRDTMSERIFIPWHFFLWQNQKIPLFEAGEIVHWSLPLYVNVLCLRIRLFENNLIMFTIYFKGNFPKPYHLTYKL